MLIDESVSRVKHGSVLVENSGATMQDIVRSVTRVTDIMGEIASASDEQSRGIEQVTQAVTQMTRSPSRTPRWWKSPLQPPPRWKSRPLPWPTRSRYSVWRTITSSRQVTATTQFHPW